MMNERQLQCFLAVARSGTVTAAAEKLFLSQPTVTYQIGSLERELGVTLFDRTRVGLEPTKAGEAFAVHARQALCALDEGRLAVSDASLTAHSTVRVCHCQFIHDVLYGPFVAEFSAAHPAANIVTTFGVLSDEMDWPAADVYVVSAKVEDGFYPPRTKRYDLYRAWTYAIVSADHPLAGRAAVSIDDCRPYTLVFPNRPFMDRCDNWYWPLVHRTAGAFRLEYREERNVHEMQMSVLNTDKVFFSRGLHMNLTTGLVQIPFTAQTPRLRTVQCVSLGALEGIAGDFARAMRAYYAARAAMFAPEEMRSSCLDGADV